MTLKEKFNNELGYDKGVIIPEKLEQIADDYAIEFLQWCENKNVFSTSVIHKPTYDKLLIQFKKEKGWI